MYKNFEVAQVQLHMHTKFLEMSTEFRLYPAVQAHPSPSQKGYAGTYVPSPIIALKLHLYIFGYHISIPDAITGISNGRSTSKTCQQIVADEKYKHALAFHSSLFNFDRYWILQVEKERGGGIEKFMGYIAKISTYDSQSRLRSPRKFRDHGPSGTPMLFELNRPLPFQQTDTLAKQFVMLSQEIDAT